MLESIHGYLSRNVYALAIVSATSILIYALYHSISSGVEMQLSVFQQVIVALLGLYSGILMRNRLKNCHMITTGYFGIVLALYGSRFLQGDSTWFVVGMVGMATAGVYFVINNQVAEAVEGEGGLLALAAKNQSERKR